MSNFKGFIPEGLDLLIENRLANSKDFYEAHKQQIRQKAITPFQELCVSMTDEMLKIDPLFVVNPSKMVSRVRRDTRYTKDKTLYRANLWLHFRRAKQNHDSIPSYYFEITPEYWSYGCFGGFGKGEMQIARELILKKDANFLKAYESVKSCDVFSFDGETYKRDRFPDNEYKDLLNRKCLWLSFYEYNDFSPLWDGSFVESMLNNFKKIAPFYNFLLLLRERTQG